MASLNKVILLGNLTRVPELRYTPGGAAVCEFGLAMNRKYTSNGQEKEETCFVNITVWGKQGESCQRYLEKGSLALVEGRLQYDQWDDRDTGKKRSTLRVVAERVQFVGGRPEGGNDSYGQSNGYQAPRQQGGNGGGYQPQGQQGGYQAPRNGGYQNPQQQNGAPQNGGQAPSGNSNGFPEMPNDAFQINNDAEDDIPF
jgi:single-strand DNA-binding protein